LLTQRKTLFLSKITKKQMPELPEVETVRRGLKKLVLNKKIKTVIVKKKNLVKQSVYSFKKELVGRRFNELKRVGKLLIFVLGSDGRREKQKYLLIHLKMTGQLVYCDEKDFLAGGHANSKKERKAFLRGNRNEFCQPGKYTHIIFEFTDKSKLFFNDLRQFGFLKIVSSEELEKVKENYGIEPGQLNFTWANFKKALQGRKTNIKALLLNQKVIAGLGNIYVDESLFLAKIHPERSVSDLTLAEQKRLFQAIKTIIKKALQYKGTTFSNFVDSQGRRGGFKKLLKVYGRSGKSCRRKSCDGIIKKIRVAGRGTHFCDQCQKKNQVSFF